MKKALLILLLVSSCASVPKASHAKSCSNLTLPSGRVVYYCTEITVCDDNSKGECK